MQPLANCNRGSKKGPASEGSLANEDKLGVIFLYLPTSRNVNQVELTKRRTKVLGCYHGLSLPPGGANSTLVYGSGFDVDQQ